MDLKSKTKKELIELAKESNIENYDTLTKTELLTALEEVLFSSDTAVSVIEEKITVPATPIIDQLVSVYSEKYSAYEKKEFLKSIEKYKLPLDQFLQCFPNHPKKELIEELIKEK